MKYILIFLFALLCSVGYAQNPISQYIGAPTTTVISRGALKADSSLILPQFPDTASANKSPYIKFYPGNLIRVFNDIYMRNTTASGWILISNGGGSNNFIDSLRKVGDSVYARKYGVFVYQYTDSAQNILANNGLSFSGDTLQLGGTLIKNTTINADSNEVRIDTASKFIVTNGLGLNHIYTDSTVTRLNVKSAIPGEQNQLQLYLGDKIDYEPQRQSQIDLSTTADGKSANLQVANYEGISLSAYEGGNQSNFNLNKDSITISPNDGILNIDSLKSNSDTIGYYPLKWNATTGKVEAYTSGFASNVLANNGLTKSLDTIQLGGALNQNTTIDGGSSSAYNMTFTNGDFILNKGNGIGGLRGNLIMSNDRGVYWNNTSGPGIGGSSVFNGISYFVPGSGYHYFYGNLNLANYGNGTKTGTPTYNLSVTSLGNVIETPLPTPTDTTSLSNRINERIDSLKRSNDSVYARKNGVFVFQYRDSVGNAGGGGGGGKIYYLNGGVSLGTFGGIPMYELGDTAVIGTAANFTRNTTGDIANFITDVGKPGLLQIPSGVWTIDAFLSETGGGSNHAQIYAVLEKWDGTTLTTIATSPVEEITNGNIPDLYTYSISVPTTTISVTDRIVIQFYIQNTNGKTVTLYTQNGYVGEVHTTFTTGIGSLNGLVTPSQTFAIGTSGTDFNIQSVTSTHTFNLPTASATNRGALSSADWSTFNGKLNPSDTISLSNRINTKLNISDTANTWVTSVFRKTASDSVFFVRGGTNNFAFRDSTGAAGWSLTGNSGTSDATNFIGTTDNQDVVFRRNNVISGRIDSSSVNFGSTTFGFGTIGTSLSTNGITAFGYKAGSLNAASTTQGLSNTAIGNRALQNNTGGSQNTAIGHNALVTLSGAVNDLTAVGAFAMENQGSGGGGSTAVGAYALRNQTFPSANTAIGAYALNLITNTGLNTAVGHSAGLYFGGSSSNNLTSSSSSTFIGYQSYAGANSQTNQTVIGANAVGAGSNTVTLGDNNITATYLKGTLGLGRTWTSSAPSVAASALLDMSSTTRGFLQPRMTNSEMNAISTPATGLSVFNTTDSLPYVYRGTSSGWQKNVTYTRTNDIGLLNGADQRLMIEPTTNIVAGRALTVEAGSTQAGGTSAFQPLSQTTRRWTGMASAPNGDIYASVQNGDIYKRTGGIGNFTALSQVSRVWQAMAAASNGDIYAVVYGGDIYKQTGGTGNFVGLGQTSRNWTGISVASNGDIYATVFGGDIYKSVGGGAFTALGQTSRNWYGVTVASNGDVYACVFNGDIWRSTNGGTTFSALSQTSRQWYGLASSSSGDIYAVVNGGDIYKQTGGTGNFIGLSQTSRAWSGITLNSNGDIYASVDNGDIYLQSQGTANLNGGTLVLQSGVGKGTGTSTISFNTGTTLASGATLQTASTKMTILGNGNVGIGTTSPSAKLELSDTARGFLQTRMTTTQMNAIVSPSVGLQVFNTTDSSNYVYRGTGGGWQRLATGSVSSVTQQTYTSGASITCNDNTTWLIIDPASLQSTLTVNLPSVPSPNQDVLISFGGTLTTGVVVNTLTISPTPLQATTPSFIEVGEYVGYRWNATNSKWYRIN